ncbi:MAG: alpha-galactosidase [Anaerolineae bacterium]|nr:alpha-galactosidase [Anaerolineae bacterium]MDW8099777.1 alpha-galactosidase [Anaerolineae bacterium]
MVQTFNYYSADGSKTSFGLREGHTAWLQQLLGLPCSAAGEDLGPPRVRGLALLDTDLGRFEGDALRLKSTVALEEGIAFTWTTSDGSLRLESQWHLSPQEGLWRRADSLHNDDDRPIVIYGFLARFPFAPGRYELYSQGSGWCNENQGMWQPLHHGTLILRNAGGRTTQGGTPYLCLREQDGNRAVAFHLLPRGNWMIRVAGESVGTQPLLFAIVELGLSTESLQLELPAGGTLRLPEVLIQAVPGGVPELAAPAFHRYVLARYFAGARPYAPVVYNTWFDTFEHLDTARLRRQLAAAQEVGCEVFTVDAGWYGVGEGRWYKQVGDWREKRGAAFDGRMADFADEVRAAGLGFGLWMEPERHHPSVPIVQAHPEWFLPGGDGFLYPDLTQQAAYEYVLGEMTRLIETYRLAWMKVDFNFELGDDRTALSAYYERWYALLDELRGRFPGVFFEGCASGGMRSDLNTLAHFDGHFLSDTVEPVDVLRITQGSLLRLPPGRMTKWACLRSAGRTVVPYSSTPEEASETILAPWDAGWTISVSADVDFAARVALTGMFGLSGDLAGLPTWARDRLRHHVAFFKRWRSLIAGAVAHLLTPIRPRVDRQGWAAIQLQEPAGDRSLLFVYRLDGAEGRRHIPLRGLQTDRRYVLTDDDQPDAPCFSQTGQELMADGIAVEIGAPYRAKVFVIEPEVVL